MTLLSRISQWIRWLGYDTRLQRAVLAAPALLCALGALFWPHMASAQDYSCTSEEDNTLDFNILQTDGTPFVANIGIISSIILYINTTLNTASTTLLNSVVANPAFQQSVLAAITLFVVFYGIGLLTGIVRPSASDLMVRAAKVGVLLSLLATGAGSFFVGIMQDFFLTGVDNFINQLIPLIFGADDINAWRTAAVGMNMDVGVPFYTLDIAASHIFSFGMFTTILASFGQGPYGIAFAVLLCVGMWFYIMALGSALWVYLSSRIILHLLIALSPIFFSFMLFSRTRNIFDGFVSQLIHNAFVVVVLLLMLSIYTGLMTIAVQNMLTLPKCWVDLQLIPGSSVVVKFWRFVTDRLGVTPVSSNHMGYVDNDTGQATPYPNTGGEFPIDIVDLITLMLFAYLNWRAAPFAMFLMRELTGVVYNPAPAGSLGGWLESQQTTMSSAAHSMMHGSPASYGQSGVGGASAGANTISRMGGPH